MLKDESLDKKEIQKCLEILEDHYDLQELRIVTDKVEKDEEVLYIYGKVNPEKKGEKVKKKKHSEYTPKNIEIKVVGDHKVAVTYEYDKEAHSYGKQNFTVTIDLSSVESRKVTQTVDGNNLALKPEGKDRGYHLQAGKLAFDKYGLDLDSAHILADQFLGSGYKSALNLLVTSGKFNKETMKKAEDSIKDKIKTIQNDNPNKIVTFDMTAVATFEVLPDDKLIETLQQAKPELNNDDKALKATLKKLNEKQEPRRCEVVE